MREIDPEIYYFKLIVKNIQKRKKVIVQKFLEQTKKITTIKKLPKFHYPVSKWPGSKGDTSIIQYKQPSSISICSVEIWLAMQEQIILSVILSILNYEC